VLNEGDCVYGRDGFGRLVEVAVRYESVMKLCVQNV